jgi:hypothetical protein
MGACVILQGHPLNFVGVRDDFSCSKGYIISEIVKGLRDTAPIFFLNLYVIELE